MWTRSDLLFQIGPLHLRFRVGRVLPFSLLIFPALIYLGLSPFCFLVFSYYRDRKKILFREEASWDTLQLDFQLLCIVVGLSFV